MGQILNHVLETNSGGSEKRAEPVDSFDSKKLGAPLRDVLSFHSALLSHTRCHCQRHARSVCQVAWRQHEVAKFQIGSC